MWSGRVATKSERARSASMADFNHLYQTAGASYPHNAHTGQPTDRPGLGDENVTSQGGAYAAVRCHIF